MNLYPVLSKTYPTGYNGGECVAFLHNLCTFPVMPPTLAEKEAMISVSGGGFFTQPNIAQVGKGFRIGDVVFTNESLENGHGFFVENIVGNDLVAMESNYHLDGLVTHGRLVPMNSPHIIGLGRFPLKFDLGNLNLNYNVFLNNQKWSEVTFLDDLEKEIAGWTNGKLQIKFFPEFTACQNWWYGTLPFQGAETTIIADDYMKNNVLPLAFTSDNKPSDIYAFIVRPDQWQGSIQGGVELAYTVCGSKPGQIQGSCAENDPSPWYSGMRLINHILPHELAHWLYYINGLDDKTHSYDNTLKILPHVFDAIDFTRVIANL